MSEHDAEKVQEGLTQFLVQCCVTAFIHMKWGYFLPLVIGVWTQVPRTPLAPADRAPNRAFHNARPVRGSVPSLKQPRADEQAPRLSLSHS